MELYLSEPFASKWADCDPFDKAFSIEGEIYRSVKGRRTSRFEFEGASYFIKTHSGVGLKEVVKNMLCLRSPVVGAQDEKNAIETLQKLGIASLTIMAYGKRGINPANQQSFIITKALEPTEDLESYFKSRVLSTIGVQERREWVKKLAEISHTLHNNGVNHRDYYLCHFLLDTTSRYSDIPVAKRPLYLIDLHRAQIRKHTPKRWRNKDLAGLYYSAQLVGFNYKDALLFIRHYKDQPLRQAIKGEKKHWLKISNLAKKLHNKGVRKGYHG